jgi:hypothetical protein
VVGECLADLPSNIQQGYFYGASIGGLKLSNRFDTYGVDKLTLANIHTLATKHYGRQVCVMQAFPNSPNPFFALCHAQVLK